MAAIRAKHPRFFKALLADAKTTAAYRAERSEFRGRADALAQAVRLMWVSDAFAAQALYRAKARWQSLGIPILPRLAHRLAMMIAQVTGLTAGEFFHAFGDAHIYLNQEDKIVFGASLMKDGEKNVQYAEPRPDGLTAMVAREKKTIIVEDMSNHPLYKDTPNAWQGSIIGLPLRMGNRVVGVMNLARSKAGEFNQAEIRLLTLLSDQAAIAVGLLDQAEDFEGDDGEDAGHDVEDEAGEEGEEEDFGEGVGGLVGGLVFS